MRSMAQTYVSSGMGRSGGLAKGGFAHGTPRAAARAGDGPVCSLRGLAQLLGVRERLQLLERPVLDLADALAGDVEGATDLLQGARTTAGDAVAHFDHVPLAAGERG